MRGRQTVPRAGLGRAIQALSRVDETTNIQCLIDAKYVTQGVEQRGELEYGSGGDLWSIQFRLIDGHSGKTFVIKVKSHLEDARPISYPAKQNCFSSDAGELLGGCRSRGGSEAFGARHESGTVLMTGRNATAGHSKQKT